MQFIHSRVFGWILVAAAVAASGCETSSPAGADMESVARQIDASQRAEQAAADAKTQAEAAAKEKAEAAAAQAEQLAQEKAAAEQAAAANTSATASATVEPAQGTGPKDKIGVGTVGKRTRRNSVQNGPLQYYGAISNARIVFQDRTLGWQIQKAMDFYVNTHDGKYPKDTEEYMREIVVANSIELPELQENQEYFYDPEDHELKIGEIIEGDAAAAPADGAQ